MNLRSEPLDVVDGVVSLCGFSLCQTNPIKIKKIFTYCNKHMQLRIQAHNKKRVSQFRLSHKKGSVPPLSFFNLV